jgi:hypothetical protein
MLITKAAPTLKGPDIEPALVYHGVTEPFGYIKKLTISWTNEPA